VKIEIGGDLEEKKMSKLQEYAREVTRNCEVVNKILQ
jgi:hypothetical protein